MIAARRACNYGSLSNAGSGRYSLLGHRVLVGARTNDAPAAEPDLKRLFETHYAHVWRLLLRFGVREAEVDDAAQEVFRVDDAAQEVFRVVACRIADIRAGSERAFLYGVALRTASNQLRRERARPAMTELESLVDVGDPRSSPEEQLEQRRARALLDAVLDQMPLELRSVLVLAELEGLAVKEIAELEGLALGTASSRLRRARETFSAIAKRVRTRLTGPEARPR